MASTIRQVIEITADTDQAQREVDGLGKSIGDTEKQTHDSAGRMGTSLKKLAGVIAAGYATDKVIDFAKAAHNAAVDQNEQVSKVGVVFKANAKDVLAWSKSSATAMGMSRTEALTAAGTFGNMLIPMGFARGKAADMSKGMVQLAADLASFNNADPSQVLEDMRSGLAGETEPLRKYGVFLNDATIKQQAMTMGLYTGKGELTAAAKTQAIYALTLKQTTDAQGDFTRTSGSNANQARIAKAEFANLSASLGQALIPAVNGVLRAFNSAMPAITAGAQAVSDWVVQHWPQITAVFGAVAGAAVALFQKLRPTLDTLLTMLMAVVDFVVAHWDQISAVIDAVFTVVATVLNTAIKVVQGVLTAFVQVMAGVIAAVQAIVGPVTNAAKAAWTAISAALTAPLDIAGWLARNVVAPIVGFVATAADKGRSIAANIWHGFTSVVTDVAGWVNNRIIQPLTGKFSELASKGLSAASNVWQGFTSVVTDMVGWIGNRILQPIVSRLTAIFENGKNMAERVWQGFRSVATDMVEWVRARVIAPITDRLGAILEKGKDIAESIAGGMRQGAAAVADTVRNAFVGFLNRIIGVINKLPFVDIPRLAEGGIVRGPTMALVGEDGTEAVIPVSAKHRDRGRAMLVQAARLLGVEGDLGEPGGMSRSEAIAAAQAAGIPMFGLGGWVVDRAKDFGDQVGQGASAALSGAKQGAAAAWNEAGDLARAGVGHLIGLLPDLPDFPDSAAGVARALALGVRDAAIGYIRGIFQHKDEWGSPVGDAADWAKRAVSTGHYTYGGGHGGWDFTLPKGYDCSGFASHAAKRAGSTLGAPVTTGGAMSAGSSPNTYELGVVPALWGLRGDLSAGGKKAHMGIRLLGDWYSFGPAFGDSNWTHYRIPPGMPGYESGSSHIPATGPAMLHAGEAVLNRGDAATYRAGRAGNVTVVVEDGALAWLRDFIRVYLDDATDMALQRGYA